MPGAARLLWMAMGLLGLAACRAPALPFPMGGSPDATAAPPTPAPTVEAAMGTPPGPVLDILPLPTGVLLVGVGPVGDVETGFEWQVWRGHDDVWQRLAWPAQAIPRSLRATPAGDTFFAVPLSRALFGPGQPWGLMRSSDGGQSWQQILTGVDDPYVMDLLVSPAFAGDGTLLIDTWTRGVYYSTDLGDRWHPLPPRKEILPSGGVNAYDLAVAVSPDYEGPPTRKGSHGLMLASFSHQLQRWDARSQTWRTIPLTVTVPFKDFDPPETQLTAGGLAFSPDFVGDGTIYALSGAAGVFRSVDRGETWQPAGERLPLSPPPEAEGHLAAASSNEAFLLLPAPASSGGGQASGGSAKLLYRTQDGGDSWEALQDSPVSGGVTAFTLTRDEGGRPLLWLGGRRGGVARRPADSLHWR
jgi:photosystem II stability/assembly factor-like uncharacterized protein